MQTKNGIFIKNIYYMLAYAFEDFKKAEEDLVEVEKFDNALLLFAYILKNGISHQIKQGLLKDYVEVAEELPSFKGKLDIKQTIPLKMRNKNTLVCKYDEFSSNNLLNSILKSTLLMLVKSKKLQGSEGEKLARDLKKVLFYFGGVEEIDLKTVKWNSIVFNSVNARYRLMIAICKLAYEELLLSTDSGENRVNHLFNEKNLHTLYQNFIYKYFEKEWTKTRQDHGNKKLKMEQREIKWDISEEKIPLLPKMIGDIILEYRGHFLIIDAKFYKKETAENQGKESYHSSHFYQIFSYTINKDRVLKKRLSVSQDESLVEGMLLYAKTPDSIIDKEILNSQTICGLRISVEALDLNQDFLEGEKSLKNQLDKIASEFIDRVELKN